MESNFIERTECPACGGAQSLEIYRCGFGEDPIKTFLDDFYRFQGGIEHEYLEGFNYVLEECRGCGLVFQKHILNDALMERLYERWIDPGQAIVHEQEQKDFKRLTHYASEIMSVVAFLGREPRELSFLDFGMGWGRWCQMAQSFGCHVAGMELSPARIENARKLGIEIVEWQDLPQREFDFINTEQVFEHIPEPLETLRHLVRALKPGGLVKISVPEGSGIRKKLRIGDWSAPKRSKNTLNPVSPLEHINCFKRSTIFQKAELTGLEPVRISGRITKAYRVNQKPLTAFFKALMKPAYQRIFNRGTYQFLQMK